MIGIFKWGERGAGADTAGLGTTTLALPQRAGSTVPASCVGVIVDQAGRTRRVAEGGRLAMAAGETGYCFHPGPYGADLIPFAAAPEIGLRVSFAVDCPDPRVAQQRFDLFLASEAQGRIELAAFAATLEAALRRELAQGNLDLPPCTSLDEWNAFRSGFNQLLYTRFGVSVDDCVPVDLADSVDFAQLLLARAASEAQPGTAAVAAHEPQPAAGAQDDARALRRLFLELPCVMCALRLAVLPPGQELFRQHQALLQRLDQVSLSVNTMPALGLAAPGRPLAASAQARRVARSVRAVIALDEAWSLLARLNCAGGTQLAALFEDADRIIANLEHEIAARRLVVPESEAV